MELRFIAWLAAGWLALACLTRLMQTRQDQLKTLLQGYVQSQQQWARKRAKATRLAQQLARAPADEEAAPSPLQESFRDFPDSSRQQKAA